MGAKSSNRNEIIEEFKKALRNNNTKAIKELAKSEELGDANMLNMAIREGYTEILKYLLDSCSNPYNTYRPKSIVNWWIWNYTIGLCPRIRYIPATKIGNAPAVRILLVRGAKICSEEYSKSLINAAKEGNEEIFYILKSHDVDAKIADKEFDNLIQMAVATGNYTSYRLLLELKKPYQEDNAVLPKEDNNKVSIPIIPKKKELNLKTDIKVEKVPATFLRLRTRNDIHVPLNSPTVTKP